MRFWWVNQNQTFKQETQGGYLWSPKRKSNDQKNPFYETMREVAPGDLVFSFADTRIQALGVVRSYCHECPKPPEFGTAGPNWNMVGWRVEVRWSILIHQVRLKDHIDLVRPHLPVKYSPLNQNGDGSQSVYLAQVPENLAQVIGGLVGPEFNLVVAPLSSSESPQEFVLPTLPGIEEWETHLEHEIRENDCLIETERSALVLSRRGQGIFKSRVFAREKRCRITAVENPTHLIASHCKPWRDSNNEERLDGENGLMLTPSIDHLFDRGFISFEDSGRVLISPVAHCPSLRRMGVETDVPVNVGSFSSGQRTFLDYHRNSVFLQRR